MGSVIPLVLAAVAVVLAWIAPALMARQRRLRRAPRAALVAWQAVTVGGILAALLTAPAALPLVLDGDEPLEHVGWLAVAGLVSGAVLLRLLVSGHLVGTRLRAARADHRDLVDIIAHHDREREQVRVLQHPTPTAYCIPGRNARVVISQGVLDALPADELDAVVAHEQAHLEARHDLLLEFFAVAHEAVPRPFRSERALSEVRLLVEALADRAAASRPRRGRRKPRLGLPALVHRSARDLWSRPRARACDLQRDAVHLSRVRRDRVRTARPDLADPGACSGLRRALGRR